MTLEPHESEIVEGLGRDSSRPIPPFSDPEFARAAGLKSAEKARELKALAESDPEAYFAHYFARDRVALAKALMDAAFGRGDYEGLTSADRLKALFKALEYSVGKPTSVPKQGTAPEPEPEPRLEVV